VEPWGARRLATTEVAMSKAGDNLATADVYAGDMAAPDLPREPATDVFLLAIEADAEPDVRPASRTYSFSRTWYR
jgi:hypothetical protein